MPFSSKIETMDRIYVFPAVPFCVVLFLTCIRGLFSVGTLKEAGGKKTLLKYATADKKQIVCQYIFSTLVDLFRRVYSHRENFVRISWNYQTSGGPLIIKKELLKDICDDDTEARVKSAF